MKQGIFMIKNGKKRKLKGFTLVEAMTSLVIMVILITIASGVIITTFNIFARNTLYRVAQENGNNVYNYIYDHVSYATSLKIDESVDININGNSNTLAQVSWLNTEDTEKIETEGSELYRIKPYYEEITFSKSDKSMFLNRKDIKKADGSLESFYIYGGGNTMNGCECAVSFEPYVTGSNVLNFSVTISRDDEDFYSRNGSIPLLNECVKEHISIPEGGISFGVDEYSVSTLQVFYTYIQ